MKVKTLALAAGTCTLLFAGTASAEFLGIDVVKFNDYMGNLGDQSEALPGNWGRTTGAHPLAALHGAHQASGLSTYRLYATFSQPIGNVASVGTVSQGGIGDGHFTAKSGTFWHAAQTDDYGNELPPSMLAPATPFPTPLHVADTYITVGQFANSSANFAPDSALFRAQTNNMGDGLSYFSYQNSGIFLGAGQIPTVGAPSQSQQGLVNDGLYRVLVMQLSVLEDGTGKAGIEGTIGHLGMLDLNNQPLSFFAEDLQFSSGQQQLPAPGALALLGLAGLAGARRRRA